MSSLFWLVVAWLICAQPALSKPEHTVGLLVDNPSLDTQALIDTIVQVCEADFAVRAPGDKIVAADFDKLALRRGFERLLADPEVDIIVAYGLLASHLAARWPARLSKPVVSPFVFDIEVQGLPLLPDGTTGVHNLAYLAYPNTLDADLRTLQELAPFRHVAMLVFEPYLAAVPRAPRIEAAAELGFEVSLVGVPQQAPLTAIEQLPEGTDAVYVTPLSGIGPAERQAIADALKKRGLPSFSAVGGTEIEKGFLAGLNDDDQIDSVNRKTALVVHEILLGGDPKRIPVTAAAVSRRLTLNVATAKAVNASPPWETWFEAELVEETPDTARVLTLSDAVERALAANEALLAADSAIDAARAGVGRARGRYLPQIDLRSELSLTDPALADATLGLIPERQWTASVSVEQLLFSDRALAEVRIRARQLDQQRAEFDARTAEVVRAAGLAWADAQKAGALVAVRANNVDEIERHLKVARAQLAVGSAVEAEVQRWAAELANARRAHVDAQIQRRHAHLALNQVLAQPLDTPIALPPLDPDALPGLEGTRVIELAGNPVSFLRLGDILVADALERSPEIAALDEAIAAARKARGAAVRSYILPTLGATARFDAYLDRSAPPEAPALTGLPPLTSLLPDYPDNAWRVGLGATLPLLDRGSRNAEIREANAQMAALEHKRRLAEIAVAARVRSALDSVNGALANRRLAEEAAVSADRSRQWAAAAYARGAVSQLAVIEAQRAAVDAALAHDLATAVFLARLLDLQWAVGRQYGALPDEEWRAFLTFLEEVLDEPSTAPPHADVRPSPTR